ncbi:MAG: hypothetical protein IPP41_07835 [Rhodocyclaceae bacterium]|nr:hypothetical protein [Rhodocyclaceae bacterium]
MNQPVAFLPDLRLALRLIIRSRVVLIAVIVGSILCGVAWLAGQFSPRQPATVALDVGLSFIRVVLPTLALLQIQDLVAREVERRLVLTSLTYPHSRSEFLLARFGAVVLVALVTCLFFSALLAGAVSWVASVYPQATNVSLGPAFVFTSVLVWFDVTVVVAFGLVLATVATTPHLVFVGGIGFMIIARSASTIIQLLETDRDVVRGAEWYHQGLQWVQWIVPDLAMLDVRPAALYNKLEFIGPSPWILMAMPTAYVVVLLVIACAGFSRRRFD